MVISLEQQLLSGCYGAHNNSRQVCAIRSGGESATIILEFTISPVVKRLRSTLLTDTKIKA